MIQQRVEQGKGRKITDPQINRMLALAFAPFSTAKIPTDCPHCDQRFRTSDALNRHIQFECAALAAKRSGVAS